MIKRSFLLANFLVIAPLAFAGNNSFLCSIEHSYRLDPAAAALIEELPSEYYVGQAFSVDRETGQVVGEAISSRSAEPGQPIVLNAGLKDPRGNKDKSVVIIENGVEEIIGQNGWSAFWYNVGTGSTAMDFLQIVEYKSKDGKHPFQLATQTGIFTGFCT